MMTSLNTITAPQFDKLFIDDTPMIDVRSKKEFLKGAFPNATNLPILDDAERHEVGLCYKESGADADREDRASEGGRIGPVVFAQPIVALPSVVPPKVAASVFDQESVRHEYQGRRIGFQFSIKSQILVNHGWPIVCHGRTIWWCIRMRKARMYASAAASGSSLSIASIPEPG